MNSSTYQPIGQNRPVHLPHTAQDPPSPNTATPSHRSIVHEQVGRLPSTKYSAVNLPADVIYQGVARHGP